MKEYKRKKYREKNTRKLAVIQRNRKANGRVFHLESMYFRVTYISSAALYRAREKRFEAYNIDCSFFF